VTGEQILSQHPFCDFLFPKFDSYLLFLCLRFRYGQEGYGLEVPPPIRSQEKPQVEADVHESTATLLETSAPNKKSNNFEASLFLLRWFTIRAAFIIASGLPRCFLILHSNKTTSMETRRIPAAPKSEK
jgi:hypothetical protein